MRETEAQPAGRRALDHGPSPQEPAAKAWAPQLHTSSGVLMPPPGEPCHSLSPSLPGTLPHSQRVGGGRISMPPDGPLTIQGEPIQLGAGQRHEVPGSVLEENRHGDQPGIVSSDLKGHHTCLVGCARKARGPELSQRCARPGPARPTSQEEPPSPYTWAVAPQHPRLDERGRDRNLAEEAAVGLGLLCPRPRDEHLHPALDPQGRQERAGVTSQPGALGFLPPPGRASRPPPSSPRRPTTPSGLPRTPRRHPPPPSHPPLGRTTRVRSL